MVCRPRPVLALACGLVSTLWLLIVAPSPAASQQAPPAEAAPARPAAPVFRVSAATSKIEVDGRLDEPAWAQVTPIPLAYEWFPGDNVEPPVATEALVTFDTETLYVGFRCRDPRPAEIRAHLMDRDSITTFVQDDHVVLLIDPFNDQRRAFQFRVNPLGVQADAIFSQIEGVEDFSWDIIWASAGRIDQDGYVVELAIPLAQIRFPRTASEQTWGFELSRSYPRSVRHRMSANPRNRDETCLLCQVNKLTGFVGLEPGRNVELDPTLTAGRTDTRPEFPDGDLEDGEEDIEPGLSARWGITPNLTLNATVNPDFSQVEADAAQLGENERFALFFPEKRPFFLEGIDFFATPINAVFTRTVVDPDWGLKLSGKEGSSAGGLFVTRDTHTTLTIPANQFSRSAFLEDEEVTGSVLRYRRDVGASSTVGVLYAGREGDAYHNRVAGVDGFVQLRPTDELRFQLLRSDTLYPRALAADFDQPDDGFSGQALTARYQHVARNWFWNLSYDDLDPEFRADSGFVPRVDLRTLQGGIQRTWWGGQDDWFTQVNLGLQAGRSEDHAGELTDDSLEVNGSVTGPLQSVVQLAAERTRQQFLGTLYEDLDSFTLFAQAQPVNALRGSILAVGGETIDFQNNQEADQLLLLPAVELKLGRHVNAQVSHLFQRLDVPGGRLFDANLSQLRLVYNVSTRTFVRGILQYLDLERRPEQFDFPVRAETETLFTQLLFSYKLNPQTVLFLGYSDNRLGVDAIALTQTDRTLFFKVGYAFVL